MDEIAIVAIPAEDDPVWKVSSEKVPHLTLLYMKGPFENEENTIRFVEHAVSTSLSRFGLSVDRRGTLGKDDADVLFFDKNYGGKELIAFRGFLLSNKDIYAAYKKAEQYPIWTPHITLGYPETPAHPNPNDYGISWINFDRIAIWTGDYSGPEFVLKKNEGMEVELGWSEELGDHLMHYGVRGMKWGVRKGLVGIDSASYNPRAKVVVADVSKKSVPTRKESKIVATTTRQIRQALDSDEAVAIERTIVEKYQKTYPNPTSTSIRKFENELAIEMSKVVKKEAAKYDLDAYVKLDRSTADDFLVVGKPDDVAELKRVLKHAVNEVEIIPLNVIRSENSYEIEIVFDDSELEQSELSDLDDVLIHFGVRGMKWGVRRMARREGGAAAMAYAKRRDAKWLAKVEANPKLGKISAKAAREARRLTKKLKKDYKDNGLDIKKDSLARTRYDAELKNILESSLDRAAYKVHRNSPSRLSEVAIHRHPDGSITALVQPRHNAKLVKQKGRIAKRDARRATVESREALREAKRALKQDVMDPDEEDISYDGLEFTLTVDDEGYVDDVQVPGDYTDEELEQAITPDLVDDVLHKFKESDVKRDARGQFARKDNFNPGAGLDTSQVVRGKYYDIDYENDKFLFEQWGIQNDKHLEETITTLHKTVDENYDDELKNIEDIDPGLKNETYRKTLEKERAEGHQRADNLRISWAKYKKEQATDIQKSLSKISKSLELKEPPEKVTGYDITKKLLKDKFKHSESLESLDDVLMHFGVRGMKWGVRRPIGSSGLVEGTVAGAIKSGQTPRVGGKSSAPVTKGKKTPIEESEDHKKMVSNLNKKVEELSTNEIRELTNRIKAIDKFAETTEAQKAAKASAGRKLATWALGQVQTGAKNAAGEWLRDQTGGVVKGILPDLVGNLKTKKTSDQEPKAEEKKKTPEREAAVKDLATAIMKADGTYEITSKKKGE